MQAGGAVRTQLSRKRDRDSDVFTVLRPHLDLCNVVVEAERKIENHAVKGVLFSNDLFLGQQEGNAQSSRLHLGRVIDVVLVHGSVGPAAYSNIV